MIRKEYLKSHFLEPNIAKASANAALGGGQVLKQKHASKSKSIQVCGRKHLCSKERRRDGTGKGDNQKQIRTQTLAAQE
jgi:hypothetical protein